MSDRQLSRMTRKATSQIHRYLKLLIYHKMLEVLPDEEIPSQFLSNALKCCEAGHNRVSFYRIPSWVVNRLTLIEAQGKKWKEYGYRTKVISYEMFYRAEGRAVAAELFPQYKNRTVGGKIEARRPSSAAESAHDLIQKILIDMVIENGYATEATVIDKAALELGQEKAEYRLKQGITEILIANNLVKQRANNALKKKYGIQTAKNSFPYIIHHPDEKGERN